MIERTSCGECVVGRVMVRLADRVHLQSFY